MRSAVAATTETAKETATTTASAAERQVLQKCASVASNGSRCPYDNTKVLARLIFNGEPGQRE